MDPLFKRLTIAVSAMVLLGTVACSSSSSSSSAGGSTSGGVSATEKDFSIDLASSSAPAGSVTFNVSNEGPSTHEFVVIKTDDAPDALPTKDGSVNEDQVTVVDELEDVAPSTTGTLTTDLETGSYVIICNVPGHYAAGMHTAFTVS
ncbi:MAG TPA: plastocyanin/azurin family copper-binding protein [Actinomycetota bacterium]|jgi:uncharacterized cupredoxin-like copper-binding protein|nr:plastocyanin/azurin family copper-binding protein [Actinomycetota bacterium]